ncbi:MAG: hypothetical protein QOF32_674 [Gammaproteobacteria bacterium]|nr:hypothetical protein [Gammaproteobacteria bacterium]
MSDRALGRMKSAKSPPKDRVSSPDRSQSRGRGAEPRMVWKQTQLARIRGLALIFFVFLNVSLLPAKASPAPAQSPTCESHQLASLDLEISAGGAVLIPVTVNRARLYMYLEIASPWTVVSEQAVVRFALQRTDVDKVLEFTLGDKHVQQYATMSFQLGDITYSREHLLIDPQSTSTGRYTRSDIIGFLGVDFLWKMDLDLDLAHRKLNLYEPSKCPGREVYWSNQYNVVPLRRDAFGNFFFPMELDGRKLEAILTTNGSVSTLSTDVTKRVYGFDKNSSDIESVADGDGNTIAQYRAMKLTASGLTVVDEKIQLTDPPSNTCRLTKKGDAIGYTDCLYRYPLRLGNDILKRLHVYIATKENMMYFTGNADESPMPGTK